MHEKDLQVAQKMAHAWVQQDTDHNEVAKSLRYLTEHPNGQTFFDYLATVVKEGRTVVRSGRSLDYYRQIEAVCRQHLAAFQNDPARMSRVLGWAVRLMRFYQVEPNLQRPPASQRKTSESRPPKPADTTRAAAGATKPAVPPGYERGRVKKFGLGPKKSFGFIQPQAGGAQVFVHQSSLAEGVPTLEVGQEVVFRVETTQEGKKQAVDVRPLA